MVEELVERDRRDERVVGEAGEHARRAARAPGSSAAASRSRGRAVWFGCSIATIASPARKCAARSAGGASPTSRSLEPVVGLERRELAAAALERERAGRGELRRLVRRRRARSGATTSRSTLAQLEAARARAVSSGATSVVRGSSSGVEHVAERRPTPCVELERRVLAEPGALEARACRSGRTARSAPAGSAPRRASRATPGVGRPGRSSARCAHASSVSGPGASVSGTSAGRGRRGGEAGEPAARADRVEERRAGPCRRASVAGSAAIGQIHATFSGSPSGAPSAAGATATRWVTKLDDPLAALRVAQLDLDREDAGVRRAAGSGSRSRLGSRGAFGSCSRRVRIRPPVGATGQRRRPARRWWRPSSRAGRRRPCARTPVRLVIDEWTIARTSSPASGPGDREPQRDVGAERRPRRLLEQRDAARRSAVGAVRARAAARRRRGETRRAGGDDVAAAGESPHNDRPMTHSPAGSSRKPHDS